MRGWQLIYFALQAQSFGILCSAGDCFEVSADLGAMAPVLAGLDSALAATANLENATFILLPTEVPFTIKTPVTLSSQVTIQGGGAVIVFASYLRIRGTFTITNSTIAASIIELDGSVISLVNGTLSIENSTVTELGTALAAGTGTVKLEDSILASNYAPVVSIETGRISAQILKCTVRNHTRELARISSIDYSEEAISIVIDQSVIKECRGPSYLFLFSAPRLAGSITISNTEFARNTIPQVYIDIKAVAVSIMGCSFHDNIGTAVTVYANEAMFSVENSLWTGHSEVIFDFRQFTGSFTGTYLTVTNQIKKGIFFLKNTLANDKCHFTLQNSNFLDTYFNLSESSPGIVYATGCLVHISQSVIKNVRMSATHQKYIDGLIIVKIGDLIISKLMLHHSGSVSIGIGVQAGNMRINDCVLDDLQSGSKIHVGVHSGSLSLNNITFTQPTGFPFNQESIGFYVPYYFGGVASNLDLRNINILSESYRFDHGNVISTQFCNFTTSGLVIRDIDLDILFGSLWSIGSISNITMLNCIFRFAVFGVANIVPLQITGVVARDCMAGWQVRGIFGPSSSLYINCSDFHFRNVTARYLTSSVLGQVHMRNMSFVNCQFEYFAYYQVATDIIFEGFTVHRSKGGLAILFRSSLHLLDSNFESLSSQTYMLAGERVNVTLERVVLNSFSNPLRLGRLIDNFRLFITNSTFFDYLSLAGEGLYLDTGTIMVSGSNFYSFNVALIQAKHCKVSIRNSVFQDGRNNVLSRKSPSAYGGVLGCIDCTSVTIESSSFLNVSAIFGGAIAVRSVGESEPAIVRIFDSKFVMCSATAGGAVYILGTSFLIESSQFIGNEAISTGGAVDGNTYSGLQARIRNSAFYRNTAKEGGAVKWWEAQVSFINVTFQDNSAVYGPDIASFGIQIAGNYSFLSGIKGNGYPLQLTFELQDHYGQLVRTASAHDMELLNFDQVSYRGNQFSTINQGVFIFSHLTVYAKPNSRQTITGKVSYMKNGKMKTLNGSVDVVFRDCIPGEVRKAAGCEYCFPGNVSFDPTDKECSFCPPHAFCPGGNELLVDSHYWRSSNSSAILIACPMETNCIGGLESECAAGYTGKMCSNCADNYTRFRVIECTHCRNKVVEWIKVLLSLLPILGISLAMRTSSEIRLFALKQLIHHIQLLSALTFIRVSYPTMMKNSLYVFSYISSLYIAELPISCFVESGEYIKAIIGSAISPAILLLLLLCYRFTTRERIILCTSALMFTPMISLYTQIPLLSCLSIGSTGKWLLLDTEQQCWEGYHLYMIKALVLPSVLLNVLLPLLLVSVISATNREKFCIYFPLWRSGHKWCAWDLLLFCEKGVLISSLSASVVSQQLSQVTYGLMVLILVGVATAAVGRYTYVHWKLFFLVEWSLVVVAMSIGLSAYFIYSPSTDGITDWVVSGVFLLLNCIFFTFCVCIWRTQIDSLRREESTNVLDEKDVKVPPNSIELSQV